MKIWKTLGITLAAGLSILGTTNTYAQACTIKIGRVVPITGPLAEVTKDTPWVDQNKLGPINQAGGLRVGSQTCKLEHVIYDSKSTVAGAAEVPLKT